MLKFRLEHLFKLGLFWVGIVLLVACSPENNSFLGRRWHNVTGYYNSYFLAEQRLQEVQAQLLEGQDRNFYQILPLYPQFDTTAAAQYTEQIAEVIKLASISIDRHKKSNWVDDSYLVIGKARFYAREFAEATETFKYVNTKSEDDEVRHEALIWLMRTFMDNAELNNARAVADYLRKEKLNKDNLREYSKALAHYYYLRNDYAQMAAYLTETAKRSNNKEGRARLYFTLGQIYQMLGQDDIAYTAYQRSLRSNPDYELSFYARLNSAQVADLAQENDERKIRKYFAKLLKDKKNVEYRDKIYYEIGNFEARQENYQAALDNYKLSIATSVNNPRQKSFGYRKLAEAYYDSANYRLSKIYYDSVSTTTPNDEQDYTLLQERQKVMADLVDQLNTIEEKDSLLSLAAMDSTQLLAVFNQIIEQEEAQLEAQRLQAERDAARASRITQTNVVTGFNTIQDNFGLSGEQAAGKWYFYNQSLVGIGQAEFVKNWGNRALEDNWRLGSNSRNNTDVITQQQAQATFEENQQVQGQEELVAARRNEFFASLPTDDNARLMAQRDIEVAYYNLGNIFNFNLKEYTPSVTTYSTLLDRYPQTEYSPEVLFNLYRLYITVPDSVRAQQVKEKLIADFPLSSYAQILKNPNWQEENDQATAYLKTLYAQAYQLQKQEQYPQSDSVLTIGLNQHPGNSFADHLHLLRAINTGHLQSTQAYQDSLTSFIETYPESTLTPYAQELLKASQNFGANTAEKAGDAYSQNFEQPHYFIMLYKNDKTIANNLLQEFDAYNQNLQIELNTTNILLNKERALVFVSPFDGRSSSVQYLRELERSGVFRMGFEEARLQPLVISKENFEILYKSKNVEGYITFFNKYYN